jgi:hypothetical protein
MLFETLSDCLDAARKDCENNKIVLTNQIDNFEPMQYNTVQRKSFEIDTIKGKNTRKYYHIIISRLDGRYELVNYAN